jgi:hypothetical protein
LVDRSVGFRSQQHRTRIDQQVRRTGAVDFFNVLTGPELLEITDAHLPEHRERLYPPTVSLSMFLRQALEADRSCQRAVDGWAAQRAAEGLSVQSVRTGAYCRARQRLPMPMIVELTRHTGRVLSTQAHRCWHWRGRAVKLVDGSGISMPDTAANQACYRQPSTQAAGVGFPLARLVGVICLSTGAVLEAAIGAYAGKGQSELSLFRSVLSTLSAGDVLLGDALYCDYFLIATLQEAGVDVLFEQHGARRTDFRRGQRLGQRDHRVLWRKPERPQWMTRQQYAAFAEHLTVRELKVEGRILVTTLLTPRKASKTELAQLYDRRWNVELDLRSIKTTLGMATLSCKSPAMVHKELWVYLLAYNLIRLLMTQAAHDAGVHPRELSFKHTVQIWSQWRPQTLLANREVFFRLIAQLRVANRPGRIEPRARKRRPKHYPWLKIPRAQARQQIRTHGHLLCA